MTERKPKPRFIKKDVFLALITDTYFNILSITNSAKILLEEKITDNTKPVYDMPFVVAGLYTFAVEEYGKILLLKSYPSNLKNVIIDNGEFVDHDTKFEKALECLPKECKSVNNGGFLNTGFTSSGFTTDTIVNFKTRVSMFYSDLNEQNRVKELPPVNEKTLKVALDTFNEIIEDELAEFNKVLYVFK